jgi:hypothetical protein
MNQSVHYSLFQNQPGSILPTSPSRRGVFIVYLLAARVGNLSPNMGSRFSTVGEHHGTSHGQDDAALGFPAHHARVSFGGLCEGILFDHRAHSVARPKSSASVVS